jgi:hypothetical protein
MIEEINKTIREAVTNVYAQRTRNSYELQEPDYTTALAIEFPRLLNETRAFPNVRFGGCFIHQSPMVTFSSPHFAHRCELGDLLVLLRKRTIDDTRYNAALVQLKKSDSNPIALEDDGDRKQLYLYEKWPEFTLSTTHERYNVFPKAVTQGALYCIIKRNPELMLYLAEPMSTMEYSSEMTFGRFIRDAIHWQTGRAFSDEANKDSDKWSKLIWDLIRRSGEKEFRRKNICYHRLRCSDDFLDYMVGEGFDDGTPVNEDMNVGDNEETGISILFIDIDDRENRGEERRR